MTGEDDGAGRRERMLDGLRARAAPTAPAARPGGHIRGGRSRGVTLGKKLLPLAAVLLLVALAVLPSLKFGAQANRISYHVGNVTAADTQSRMQNARYHGVDQHGQPFTLTADMANDQGQDLVALRKPEGDITLKSGSWLMLRSNAGLFHQKSQMLGLHGDVTLYRNDGTTMAVDAADIDIKQSDASSGDPVQVQGPFGTLHAEKGFALTDHGTNLLFKGPAVLVLTQAPQTASP